ncbi:SDR family NAD(P)-dependent oxidoreductase [Neobacillus kokaensis]|uniref:NAD(P)-dependent oxidoreductase n=1 Tax=Neobacillus kokaensis TaxID=2759023 RepID=A0ABQ3N441_9BACI|nr:SDR family oxidoreductase [Neobacillus kokaensis]GHH99482.1 NAD(P)-dependent oxidoreductase [Neobacillus kokaensis]
MANRVALVTGAGTGLGRAIAKAFANEGLTVVLNGRSEGKLREVEDEIGCSKVIVIPADVTDEREINALRNKLLQQTGRLDILVNNVGGVPAMGQIEDMTLDQWNQVIDKNLTSQFLMTKAFLPALRNSGNGKIISVTSAMAHFYVKGFSAYSAGKAGVESLMKTVAEEEKGNNIEVHLFDPTNVVSEANPNGEKDPMEVVGPLLDIINKS